MFPVLFLFALPALALADDILACPAPAPPPSAHLSSSESASSVSVTASSAGGHPHWPQSHSHGTFSTSIGAWSSTSTSWATSRTALSTVKLVGPSSFTTSTRPASSTHATTHSVAFVSSPASATTKTPTTGTTPSRSSRMTINNSTTSAAPSRPALSTKLSTATTWASTASTSTTTSTSKSPAPTTTSALTTSSASTTTSTSRSPTAPTTTAASVTTSASPSAASIVRSYPADIVDKLRDSSVQNWAKYLQGNPTGNSCTLENAIVRKEWSDLSLAERQAYTSAVVCLQSKPARTSASDAPGAKTRFDDFVATHIEQTNSVHYTANFLSWHRYLLHTYEKALREECGYQGYTPFWNWDRYAADPANSPLFNGNASSMSGNSVNGGCVTSGPFKNMTINLATGGSLAYQPRCLKRAISAQQASECTADKSYALITQHADIASFQSTMQAVPSVHVGGHFTIGGDPGSDIFSSNGDPAFYLHHAMIDRVWWIWQMQDLQTRLGAVAGSVAGQPGKEGSLTDQIQLGVNAGAVTIGDVMSTLGGMNGELCYIYA